LIIVVSSKRFQTLAIDSDTCNKNVLMGLLQTRA